MKDDTRNSRRGRPRPRPLKTLMGLGLGLVALIGTSAASIQTSGAATAGSRQVAGFPVLKKSQIKIAIVAGGSNAYFTPWTSAANALAKALGVTVTYVVAPGATFNVNVEVPAVNALVAKGYNAFVLYPDGAAAIEPEENRLIARGIPVIEVAACSPSPTPALACFATNVEASAEYETQLLIKAIGGKGNIAFLTGLLTDPNTVLREAGVHQAIAATHGKVKLVETVSNIDTPSAAPPAVESLLASKGSLLQGMFSTDYYPSVATSAALLSNPSFRHIKFIGQDNDPTVMKAIVQHAIYGTMYQNSYGQPYMAATWLYKILADGCKINPAGFVEAQGVDHFVNSGYFFIGQQEISKYVGRPESIPSQTSQLLANSSKYLSCP